MKKALILLTTTVFVFLLFASPALAQGYGMGQEDQMMQPEDQMMQQGAMDATASAATSPTASATARATASSAATASPSATASPTAAAGPTATAAETSAPAASADSDDVLPDTGGPSPATLMALVAALILAASGAGALVLARNRV